MIAFTIKYNRTSNHIANLDVRSASSEFNYAVSACPALSRSVRFCSGKSFDDVAAALEAARVNASANGRKMCQKCEAAAVAMIG